MMKIYVGLLDGEESEAENHYLCHRRILTVTLLHVSSSSLFIKDELLLYLFAIFLIRLQYRNVPSIQRDKELRTCEEQHLISLLLQLVGTVCTVD
jgi:hypothetical protein